MSAVGERARTKGPSFNGRTLLWQGRDEGSIPSGSTTGLSDGFRAMPCKHEHRGSTPRLSTTRRCSSKAERILGKDEG